ncbi:MAG: bifunctional (p)ppGpp synthetase/guanosine-3',5'-bis(diphosphate) 3'-pyrophosphohydrolase [Firmicutes bacterium]|nr:bifunctional (p)ppGpp synthetase/guanosine-3',5'-bis(diphosphate) 3'-pyrophosphohydrolase [Bacillota bacterium]
MTDYVKELLEINPSYDPDILERALAKATELHEGQLRKSGEPYIIHPKAVGKILAELGMDDHTIAAGLLHDAVEDTPYTLENVKKDFGDDVALMVDGVTKLTNLVYTTKEEAQAENVRKMFLAMSKDIRILIIKVCDRLHNMRTIEYQTPEKIREKSRETLEIYAPIAARLGMYRFKFELEDIAFKHLYPEAYDHIYKEMEKRRNNMNVTIDTLVERIKELVDSLGIKSEIYGREKHYYSIYKKMIIQKKEIGEIFDLTAVRVIVDSVRDCYAVLGAIHTKWTPISGRFKDYIAMPKSNMYQSLHTTLLSKTGNPFEVQIRTWEMHRVAEYGIAAHWKYKEGIKDDANNEEVKLAWIRQTLEWQNEVKDSKEFMETLKVDLFSNQVFVFTPKGDVIELPAGSTPLDFAYKIHSRVGEKCVGAKVNGKMVPITYELKNGEVVEVVTSSNSRGPSIDWLKIVKTNSARAKIRQYLKKENKVQGTGKGKEALEKAAKRRDLDPEKVLKASFVERAAKTQNFSNVDDLYSALSMGGSIINKTLLMCLSYMREEEQALIKKQEREERRLETSAKKRANKNTKGVTVKGVDNLLVRFSRCCNPVPGDEIIGYTTKGRGVSIHRKDCINILNLPEEEQGRLIEVNWELGDGEMFFEAGITILADDRKGLFSDVSKVCDDMDINLTGVNAQADSSGMSTLNLLLQITNTSDIDKIIGRFRQIKDVIDVYRTNY